MRIVDVSADDPRLDAFHAGIYRDEFEEQEEPLAAWKAALRGERPHRLTVRLALDEAEAIAGGICFEQYPASGCGLATYMVIAPHARRAGLGRSLLQGAVDELFARGAPIVFGEVNDPRADDASEPVDVRWERLLRNQRWGARVLAIRYIQPALGAGLARDRGLILVALSGGTPLLPALDGTIVRAFLDEFYAITEGCAPDPEIRVPATVPLVELAPSSGR
ncbi:MAG: GNAT family N-acetyltransferase [Deltaproteobacteria bacterium]|nr:GNAT family N-acetyltransferase [Deltaproteobacteria bacterium]